MRDPERDVGVVLGERRRCGDRAEREHRREGDRWSCEGQHCGFPFWFTPRVRYAVRIRMPSDMRRALVAVRFETMGRDEDHRGAHRRRRGELRLDLRPRRCRGRGTFRDRRILHRARPDRDHPRPRAAADRRGRARRGPAVGEAALGLVGRRIVRGHRLQRDLGDRGRALGPGRPALRRADPPAARRSLPRLGADVRRLPRRRGAALDGHHDGRAPGALGSGAAGGDRGGRDPQPRARARLRQGRARRGLHARDVRVAGRSRSSPTSASAR